LSRFFSAKVWRKVSDQWLLVMHEEGEKHRKRKKKKEGRKEASKQTR
jgi:hypothetical protein